MGNMHSMRGAAPADEVIPKVVKWIEPQSTVYTDGLRAYKKLPTLSAECRLNSLRTTFASPIAWTGQSGGPDVP